MVILISQFVKICSCIPDWIYTTIARFAVGFTFFHSGLTKVDENYMVLSKTYSLFKNIYFRGLDLSEELIKVLATLAAYAELILPLLLFIGLGSRFAAVGLLIMTAVIQFVVFPGEFLTYKMHGLWAVALLAIIIRGPGPFSVDHFIRKSYMK